MKKVFYIIAALFMMVSCTCKDSANTTSGNTKGTVVKPHVVACDEILGVDISHHNTDSIPTHRVDWKALKKENVKFAYIKASEGVRFGDKKFKENVENAKKNGIKVGAYHYFSKDTSGKDQFRNFKNRINGMNLDLRPVLDLEPPSLKGLNSFYKSLDKEKYLREVNVFIDLCRKELKVDPIIYCQRYHYNGAQLGRLDKSLDIWCGIEGEKKVKSYEKYATLEPWTDRCVIWQYGQNKIGNIIADLNVVKKSNFKKLQMPTAK